MKESLDVLDNLVSVCWHVFANGVDVSSLSGLKAHSRTSLAYQHRKEEVLPCHCTSILLKMVLLC